MKKEIAIHIKNGKINLDGNVRLKDIASTLRDGSYIVSIKNELSSADADYFRKRFYKGIDIVVDETANKKSSIELEIKREIISQMASDEDQAEVWIDLNQVKEDQVFSFTWLTPRGWEELYSRFRLWAYNVCDCYV